MAIRDGRGSDWRSEFEFEPHESESHYEPRYDSRPPSRGAHPRDAGFEDESHLLELCRNLRHAAAAMEAALDRPASYDDYRAAPQRREAPRQPAPREDAHQRDYARPRDREMPDEKPAPAAITMRDMTNFLLSKEGDHFLNLIRRMIRDEMDQSSSAQFPKGRQERAQPSQTSLRDLVRRDAPARRRFV